MNLTQSETPFVGHSQSGSVVVVEATIFVSLFAIS